MIASSRPTFRAFYPDPLGRVVATVDFGTNGGTDFDRPLIAPPRSETILVTGTLYNERGEALASVDPKGIVTRSEFDHAGRLTRQIENYSDGGQAAGLNRTTEFTYNADGKLLVLTARNITTGDQHTRFCYGVDGAGVTISSQELLALKIYPNDTADTEPLETAVYDRVLYSYNRLGEVERKADLMAEGITRTAHEYDFDLLGRLVMDRVETLSDTALDGSVMRIGTSYNWKGLPERITSFKYLTGDGDSDIHNQVKREYNEFGQLTAESQAHSGPVTWQSPCVHYAYHQGQNNTIRPLSITYPSHSRVISYDYGVEDSMSDALSRVSRLCQSSDSIPTSVPFLSYDYLGLRGIVRVKYEEPGVELTYVRRSDDPDGQPDDIYTGLDRFGRVVDHRWLRSITGNTLERLRYGFDRAGNRLWRRNLVAPEDRPQDEFYTYDGLYQLTTFRRGILNLVGSQFSSSPAVAEEFFTFDPQGNWDRYQTRADGVTNLNQDREHNLANQITQIAGSSQSVAHDNAGNTTKCPKRSDWTGKYILKWDAWNRLIQVFGIGDGEQRAQYTYDGLNRRITSTSIQPVVDFYYSSEWQVLERHSGGYADQQFVWGLRHIDDLVLRDRFLPDTDPKPMDSYYALDDYLSVAAIVTATGQVEERYAYSPFGETTVLDQSFAPKALSDQEWETRFHCYRWDAHTGFYQVRYRSLASQTGRWLSRDSFQPKSISNLYWLTGNSTYAWTDPTGEIAVWVAAIITGGVIFCILYNEFEHAAHQEGEPQPHDPDENDHPPSIPPPPTIPIFPRPPTRPPIRIPPRGTRFIGQKAHASLLFENV